MTSILIPETGANVANSNTYVTVAYADSYHLLANNTDWSTAETADKELALVKATAAVDLLYGPLYLSQILNNGQSLLFPRYGFYDNHKNLQTQSTIPTCLKNAVCEAALLALAGTDMFPEVSQNANIKNQSDKVGELSTSVTYFKPPEASTFEGYRKVELLLYPILFKKSKSVNLAR